MSKPLDKEYQDEVEVEKESFGFTSIKQTINNFYRSLFTQGYLIRPRAGGYFANHDVYYRETLKVGKAENVQIHRLLEGESVEMGRFENAVDRWAEVAFGDSDDKNETKLIAAIYDGFTSASTNKNNKAFGYGLRFTPNIEKPRSCTGQLAYSQVPSLSWFPHLTSLTPERLLALFQPAEAELLMLTIGKALWGNQNVKLMEGEISHQMRSAVFIHGVAGTGKSVVMKHLTAGFKYLGYTSTIIADGMTKFGWGEVARADIAWREDMTDSVQKTILESSELKSIVTGGDISSQRKGENAVNVQSIATLFFCTNSAGKHLFMGMDAGSLDRFKFLDTYNLEEQAELEAKEGYSRNTYHNWLGLCKEYGVSSLELSVYLMAHCADKFIRACGKKIEDGQLLDCGTENLKDIVDELTNQLTIKTNLDYLKSATYSVSHLVALAIAAKEGVTDEARVKLTTKAENMAFGHVLLKQAIAAYVATSGEGNDVYAMQLHQDCYASLSTQVERWQRGNDGRNANDHFNALTKELVSKDGYKFAPTVAYYSTDWNEARKSIKRLVTSYESFDKSILKYNRALKAVLDDTWNALEKTA